MEELNTHSHTTPWWMALIIILCAIPGVASPFAGELLNCGNLSIDGLTWFYPIYSLVSALLAWQCYNRRQLFCWVILILLLISHICYFHLATTLFAPASLR